MREFVDIFVKSPSYFFDTILMDIRMPILDGLEATKAIRELERPDAKTTPIFALSANAFAEDAQKSKMAEMQEHLSKPLEVDTLFTMLQKYLSKEEAK